MAIIRKERKTHGSFTFSASVSEANANLPWYGLQTTEHGGQATTAGAGRGIGIGIGIGMHSSVLHGMESWQWRPLEGLLDKYVC
jgi:hypothetical protein